MRKNREIVCEREREREEGVKKNGGFAKNLYNIWVQGT